MLSIISESKLGNQEKISLVNAYKKYYSGMYAAAFDILKNERDAEDAISEVFLYISENIDSFNAVIPDNASFYYKAVRTKSIDIIRKRKRLVPESDIEIIDEIGISNHPDEIIFSKLTCKSNVLAVALSKLRPRYRDILILRYGEDLDTSQIAAMLGIKRNSVQRLIKRALTALKAQYIKEQSIDKKCPDRIDRNPIWEGSKK